MSSFKKVKLTEEGLRTWLDKKFGLIENMRFRITPIKTVGKNRIELYRKHKSVYASTSRYECVGAFSNPAEVFNESFFTRKTTKSTRRPYGLSVNDEFKVATVTHYLVEVIYGVINPETPNDTIEKIIEFKVKTEEEFNDITLIASKTQVLYKHPIYSEMEKGKKYFYFGKGVCELKEMHTYPNPSNTICTLMTSTGEIFSVKYGDKKLCLDLMAEKNKPSDAFNECLNELLLQPMLLSDKTKNIINLIWQPIEEASNYVIKLYRLEKDTEFCKTIYFLKNYYIDRGTHILSVDDLIVSDSYVFVVIAENRSGEIIAKSRGMSITSGKPKDF